MSKMKGGKALGRAALGFLFLALMGLQPMRVIAAGSLSEKELNLRAQNSVFFYDPYDCEEGTTKMGESPNGTFSGEEVWDGNCSSMTAARAAWLSKYVDALQSTASKNGIPWELIAGQTFQESGGGKQEACDYNPLGLKAGGGQARCANGFAKFNSYNEAFQYYMDSIIPIRNLKNNYPIDPYSAVSYIQYGSSSAYASCDSESYSQCVGHMGEPTPGYVNSVSSIICGIQKWAMSEGIAISGVSWSDYIANSKSNSNSTSDSTKDEVTVVEEEVELENGTGAGYCGKNGWVGYDSDLEDNEKDTDSEEDAGDLAELVKKWAWPTYHKPVYTKRMPDYAEYIDNVATYKGASNGVDCGAFVANIMKASGWDTNYVQSGTSSQMSYLKNNWQRVDEGSLKLGDVGIRTGHVILYVGNISGFESNTASASQSERAPMAGADRDLSRYTWYRRP